MPITISPIQYNTGALPTNPPVIRITESSNVPKDAVVTLTGVVRLGEALNPMNKINQIPNSKTTKKFGSIVTTYSKYFPMVKFPDESGNA